MISRTKPQDKNSEARTGTPKKQAANPKGGRAESAEGEQPEALAQFAQSARKGEESPKKPEADAETTPRPADNKDKHEVATRLLHEGAEGRHPDPQEEGADKLPDRIKGGN